MKMTKEAMDEDRDLRGRQRGRMLLDFSDKFNNKRARTQ